MNKLMKWEKMKNKKGFTLVEVIVVMAVIGIMVTIAIPGISSWLPNYKLKSAARDVYSSLQKARMLAVKNNRNAAVIFDAANNKYDVCDDWVSTASPPCVGSLVTTDFNSLGYGIGYGHGNATSAVGTGFDNNITYPGDDVVFTPSGLGNASGYVYLENRNNVATYAIGSLTSGSIRISKWNGSAWE